MLNSLRLFWNAITFVFGYSKISTAKGGKTVVVNVTIIKPETNVNVLEYLLFKTFMRVI